MSWYTNEKVLTDGDIINIDVTPKLDGWHGDTSRMFYVGQVKLKARKLVETTYEAMMRGIEIVKPGITTGDIGNTIQSFAEKKITLLFEIFVDMVSVKFFMINRVFFILETLVRESN